MSEDRFPTMGKAVEYIFSGNEDTLEALEKRTGCNFGANVAFDEEHTVTLLAALLEAVEIRGGLLFRIADDIEKPQCFGYFPECKNMDQKIELESLLDSFTKKHHTLTEVEFIAHQNFNRGAIMDGDIV